MPVAAIVPVFLYSDHCIILSPDHPSRKVVQLYMISSVIPQFNVPVVSLSFAQSWAAESRAPRKYNIVISYRMVLYHCLFAHSRTAGRPTARRKRGAAPGKTRTGTVVPLRRSRAAGKKAAPGGGCQRDETGARDPRRGEGEEVPAWGACDDTSKWNVSLSLVRFYFYAAAFCLFCIFLSNEPFPVSIHPHPTPTTNIDTNTNTDTSNNTSIINANTITTADTARLIYTTTHAQLLTPTMHARQSRSVDSLGREHKRGRSRSVGNSPSLSPSRRGRQRRRKRSKSGKKNQEEDEAEEMDEREKALGWRGAMARASRSPSGSDGGGARSHSRSRSSMSDGSGAGGGGRGRSWSSGSSVGGSVSSDRVRRRCFSKEAWYGRGGVIVCCLP